VEFEENYSGEYEQYQDPEQQYQGQEQHYHQGQDNEQQYEENIGGDRGLEIEYEELLRSMIERVGDEIQCISCQRSYKASQTTNLKNHIEAKHIDNIRFTCCLCGGLFSSRASFRTHSRNFHKNIKRVQFSVSQI